ncbi:MAG: hypothetical protein ACK4VP_06870 [Nitrospira sp.]
MSNGERGYHPSPQLVDPPGEANPASPTLAARHYRNNWMAKDQLLDLPHDVRNYRYRGEKRDGLRHWVHYITNTYPDPIQFVRTDDKVHCLACHQQAEKWSRVGSHHALWGEFAADRLTCVTCHGPPPPLPIERTAASDLDHGCGTFASMPLLLIAMALSISAVITDLKTRGTLSKQGLFPVGHFR